MHQKSVFLLCQVFVVLETRQDGRQGGKRTRGDLQDYLGVSKPFFNPDTNQLVRVQRGGIAYLSCEVYNMANLSVSWIRSRDSHILTVDKETFISDLRFSANIRSEKMCDFITLSITEISPWDAGDYECQVSFTPKISRQVRLVVMTPEVRILGDPDIHVKEGSKVNIECVISNTTDHVPYVTWLFNDQVVHVEGNTKQRMRHQLIEGPGDNITRSSSLLSLDKVKLSQAGQYTCKPPGVGSVSVQLHVIRDEQEQKLPMKDHEVSSGVSLWPSWILLTILSLRFIL